MSELNATASHTAGAVFDRLADTYDSEFTDSLIGRAQRNAVWNTLLKTFRSGAHLLELNCGTGEDAFFLADNGISVVACDASPKMIARAEQRLLLKPSMPPVVFRHLPTERIHELTPAQRFDGVFSNFSGLNCIANLAPVAAALSNQVNRGDKLLLCFSTRICLIEILYYLARNQKDKALRRARGRSQAILNEGTLEVFYPTVSEIRSAFAPHFRLRSTTGIGVSIPPSYLEAWARRHRLTFRLLTAIETLAAHIPLLRTTGDHMLLTFEKVTP
jgi:SAM-dependent methyltransferase